MVSAVTVGRDQEMQQLLLELEDARLGRGRLTVVAGEAGVGKSRVAADLVGVARGLGMVVLQGRAVDSGAPVPYRLIASALLPAFRAGGPPDDPALGPYRSALSLLVPAWADESRPVATTNAGLAVLEASGTLLRVLAGAKGLLAVFEDAHWSDAETLAILDYLADTLGQERVLCVVTVRPGGEAGDARRLLDRCATSASASVVELGRLDPAAIARLIQAILATPAVPSALGDFVQANAEGLPLAAEQLVAELIATRRLVRWDDGWRYEEGGDVPAPSGFQRLVERRVARLRPSTVQALKSASLLGREFDWTLLPGIAALSESEVLAALGEAVDAQLLSSGAEPGRMQFRHALIGACVAESLLPPERSRLARAAAATVEAAASSRSPARLELAADLWLQAGEPESAARLLLQLGADALGRGAVASAQAILERALEATPAGTETHVAVLELLSDALTRAGMAGRCLEVTAELPSVLRQAGCPRERVHAGWVRLARAQIGAGVVPSQARASYESEHWHAAIRALDLADAADDSAAARAVTTSVRALLAIEAADFEEACRLSDEALALARPGGASEAECEALYVKARALRGVSPESAATALERALQVVDRDGVERWRLRLLVELGLVERGNTGRADRLLAARDLARESGEVHTAAVASLNLGFPASPPGSPEWTVQDASTALEEALQLSRRHRLPTLDMVLRFRAMLAVLQSDDAAFERDMAELRVMHAGHEHLVADLHFWHGLFTEDRPLALEQLTTLRMLVGVRDAATAPFRGFYALLCAVAGCDGEAAIKQVVDTGYGSILNRGLVGLAESVVLGGAGRREDAAAAYATAVPCFHSDPLGYMGQRLVAEAAIRDGWGAPAEWLTAAHEFFDSSGLRAPMRACAAMLRGIGEPVARRGRGDAVVPQDLRARGVTSREMDVLLLVREGLSNNEIAKRLFMSRRTVETHVSHLLAKLEASSRGRLAAKRESER